MIIALNAVWMLAFAQLPDLPAMDQMQEDPPAAGQNPAIPTPGAAPSTLPALPGLPGLPGTDQSITPLGLPPITGQPGLPTASPAATPPIQEPAPGSSVAPLGATLSPAEQQVQDALVPVREAIFQRDYDKALDELKKVEQIDPNSPALVVYRNLITRRRQASEELSIGGLRPPPTAVSPGTGTPAVSTGMPDLPTVPQTSPGTDVAASGTPATEATPVPPASSTSSAAEPPPTAEETSSWMLYGIGLLLLVAAAAALWKILHGRRVRAAKPTTDGDSEISPELAAEMDALRGGPVPSLKPSGTLRRPDFTPDAPTAMDTHDQPTELNDTIPADSQPPADQEKAMAEDIARNMQQSSTSSEAPKFDLNSGEMTPVWQGSEQESEEEAPLSTAPQSAVSTPDEAEGDSETVSLDAMGFGPREDPPAPPVDPLPPIAPPADPPSIGAPAEPLPSLGEPEDLPKLDPLGPLPGAEDLPSLEPLSPPDSTDQPKLADPNEMFSAPPASESPMAGAPSIEELLMNSYPGIEPSQESAPSQQPDSPAPAAPSDPNNETINLDDFLSETVKSQPAVPKDGVIPPTPAPVAPAESVDDDPFASMFQMPSEAQEAEPSAPADIPPAAEPVVPAPAPAAEKPAAPKESVDDLSDRMFREQYDKAKAAMDQQNWKQAVHFLSIASAIHPDHDEVRQMLREARNNKRQAEEQGQ